MVLYCIASYVERVEGEFCFSADQHRGHLADHISTAFYITWPGQPASHICILQVPPFKWPGSDLDSVQRCSDASWALKVGIG